MSRRLGGVCPATLKTNALFEGEQIVHWLADDTIVECGWFHEDRLSVESVQCAPMFERLKSLARVPQIMELAKCIILLLTVPCLSASASK